MEQQSSSISSYLSKYADKVANDFQLEKCKIKVLSDGKEDLLKAAEEIKSGKLVSFPTETVYGLGANALQPESVRNIFLTKRRPFTDPVIVHVISIEQALEYVVVDEYTKDLFTSLAAKLWPGPITFILPANFNKLDRILTAQSDFVGVRWPSSKTAQELIKLAGVPIAAPSANLFSHVSPTSSIHVFNDFFDQEFTIIDGEECSLGVESTVVKLNKNEIEILRYGSISEKQLQAALDTTSKFKEVTIKKKMIIAKENQNQEAPGQLLKHYSPKIDCFLFQIEDETKENVKIVDAYKLNECIVLDFNNQAENLAHLCLQYKKMSDQDDMREVMKKLYDLLRWAENVQQVKAILIYNVKSYYEKYQNEKTPEFFDTVFDKIFRSSEGKQLTYLTAKSVFVQRE